jgi:hypothetical protein
MANRSTRLILKNSDIVNRPYSGATLLAGEAIVNTADGIMLFSGVTTSTSEWTPSGLGGNANFFEVGSNLYDLKLRNRLTKYEGIDGAGLVGKFLSGTTNGFTLADISAIQGVDSYLTGGTFNNTTNLLTLQLNEGKSDVTVTIDANHNALNNLQGGTSGEYYHLTATEYGAVTGASSPSAANPFATIADITAASGDTYVTGNTSLVLPTNSTPTYTTQLGYNQAPVGGPYSLTLRDAYITGGTLTNGIISLEYNDSNITGNTIDISSIDVNDTYVTGGTVTSATDTTNQATINLSYKNDEGGSYTLPFENTYITGGTLSGTDLLLDKNDGVTETIDLSALSDVDTKVTAFTYNNANTFTIFNSDATSYAATINTVTGMTNTGNLDLQGELANSTGNVVINDNLDITGTTTSWGNILPGAHLTYDLGASGQRWDELWVRKIQIGTTTTTLSEEGGNFEMSGNTGDFVFKPSVNSTFYSDLLPDADLTRDIGSPSLRWNIYAGNLSATGLTITGLGSGRVVYTDGSGGLTTEAGFEYNDTTNTITVGNLNVQNPSGTTSTIGQGGLVIGSGGSFSSPGIGDLIVHGDFTVFGTATTVSTNELYVEDPQITLNYNPTGDTSSTSIASGIRIQDGDGSGNDVFLTVAQMNTFTGGDVTEYSGANGYTNRSFLTQLNDIVIRNTNLNNGAPDGVRVLAEFDVLDGGTY